MATWLVLALVVGVAAVASFVLLAVWRTRRTAPRTLSLLLGWAACAAIVLAVVDVPLPGAYLLCGPPVRAGERSLADAIESELDAWRWWWTPCRHLRVTATRKDLDQSIDFSKLAALAAGHAVAVDVSLEEWTNWPGESLEWSVQDARTSTLARRRGHSIELHRQAGARRIRQSQLGDMLRAREFAGRAEPIRHTAAPHYRHVVHRRGHADPPRSRP